MKNFQIISVIIFIISVSCILTPALKVGAVGIGDTVDFNVDKSFDASARNQISAVLVKTTNSFYFYIEKLWWDTQVDAKKSEVLSFLENLSLEFINKIYPTLTSTLGFEWRPGIDGDEKTTILFHSMNANEGGYFRELDEYIKLQIPNSNEREMIYLSLDYITDPKAKIVLAHEFAHLITFNQKNKNFNIEEDVWLNEARADYTSTILGYDDNYQGSNFQQRVRDFVENPSDSVTEWQGTKYDYASASMFLHYLTDHYGVSILYDSLKLNSVGLESITRALLKIGYEDDFSEIFTNWTIASVLNNCSVDIKYCYKNPNLKNFKLSPSLNFLPLTGNVSLSVSNVTKSWTGNWFKFIGGDGDLRLGFSTLKGLKFKIPYILESNDENYKTGFLALNEGGKSQLDVPNFGDNYKSLTIIPSLQSETYRADGPEPTYPFTYTVEIIGSGGAEDQDLIQQLLDRIAYLKSEIAKLINGSSGTTNQNNCQSFQENLYFGITHNSQVKCLQEFLKNQGGNIYPEGLMTGNFGNLTKSAVIRFQANYNIPQTGYVGPITRNKINQIIGGL